MLQLILFFCLVLTTSNIHANQDADSQSATSCAPAPEVKEPQDVDTSSGRIYRDGNNCVLTSDINAKLAGGHLPTNLSTADAFEFLKICMTEAGFHTESGTKVSPQALFALCECNQFLDPLLECQFLPPAVGPVVGDDWDSGDDGGIIFIHNGKFKHAIQFYGPVIAGPLDGEVTIIVCDPNDVSQVGDRCLRSLVVNEKTGEIISASEIPGYENKIFEPGGVVVGFYNME